MKVVLDTNVVSELFRPDRVGNADVRRWFDTVSKRSVHLNRVTQAEIWAGAYGHRDARQSELLFQYWDELSRNLSILDFDLVACKNAARFLGSRKRRGRPVFFADAAIAGIAMANHCALATRNTKDFEGSDLILVNPFEPPEG